MNARVRTSSRSALPRGARRAALGLGLVVSGRVALITLGAIVPAVPVLGYYATTWVGPRPLWYVVFGLVIAVGAVVAWRRGRRRTAVWTTVTSAVTAIGAATVLNHPLLSAHPQNTPLSAADVLAVDQPTPPPDHVIAYDHVEGRTLRAGLWAPRTAHPQGKKPMVVWRA